MENNTENTSIDSHLPSGESLLTPYVSELNDGVYTLDLGRVQTERLWKTVDAQTGELKKLRSKAAKKDAAFQAMLSALEKAEDTIHVSIIRTSVNDEGEVYSPWAKLGGEAFRLLRESSDQIADAIQLAKEASK